MLDLNVFECDKLYREFNGKKLAAHVLWFDGSTIEIVDTCMTGDVINRGFEYLKYRFDKFAKRFQLTSVDYEAYRDDAPGCNLAVFKIDGRCGKNFKYQLNFVELI
jgi:hypothetical protein